MTNLQSYLKPFFIGLLLGALPILFVISWLGYDSETNNGVLNFISLHNYQIGIVAPILIYFIANYFLGERKKLSYYLTLSTAYIIGTIIFIFLYAAWAMSKFSPGL